MSEVASVKGSLFKETVKSLCSALEGGTTTPDELAQWLHDGDFVYLGHRPIAASGWYPADAFQRLTTATFYVVAKGDLEYYRDHGAKAVTGFMGAGAYKGYVNSAEAHIARAGEILVGASQMLFNFSKWTFSGTLDEGFLLDVTEATLIPESFAYATVGFFEAFFEHATGRPVKVDFERLTPDHFVVRGGWTDPTEG